MGERLLRKIYTKEAIEKMSEDQFQAAKKAEKQRLKILHTQQVRSSRADRLPCESYLLVEPEQVLVSAC